MGFNKGIPYPILDGHPRRIKPIPISKGPIQFDEMREGYAQVAKTILGQKFMILQELRSPQEGLVVLVSPLLEKPAYQLRGPTGFEKKFAQ